MKKTVESKCEPKRRGRPPKSKQEFDDLDENVNHWGDAKSYAKDYVGDVAYHTTRFDNDWN